MEVWFWYLFVSPHMAGLAAELALRGVRVNYVAKQRMSPSRKRQGWRSPPMPGVTLHVLEDGASIMDLATASHESSVHICEGIRGNGVIGDVQKILAKLGRFQMLTMEAVDDVGWKGLLKRIEYARRFYLARSWLGGVLAIGHSTTEWVVARGVPRAKVYPFAYFLEAPLIRELSRRDPDASEFSLVYVGRLVPVKRVDSLLRAIAQSEIRDLTVIGDGPDLAELRALASELEVRVTWKGQLSSEEVQKILARADVLVLPSRYDGWGAVVSEALMAGARVICSSNVGARRVAKMSGAGRIFQAGSVAGLSESINAEVKAGRQSSADRAKVADWAVCLGSRAGAKYLEDIVEHAAGRKPRPSEPWEIRAEAHAPKCGSL